VRQGGGTLYDVLCHIEDSLVGVTLGEDGGLGDVKFQVSILIEDMIEIRYNLKYRTQLVLNVTIVYVYDYSVQMFIINR
jgi:hypothetical protein